MQTVACNAVVEVPIPVKLCDWTGTWDITQPLQIPLLAQPAGLGGLHFDVYQETPGGGVSQPPAICGGLLRLDGSTQGLYVGTLMLCPPPGMAPQQPPGGFPGLHLIITQD